MRSHKRTFAVAETMAAIKKKTSATVPERGGGKKKKEQQMRFPASEVDEPRVGSRWGSDHASLTGSHTFAKALYVPNSRCVRLSRAVETCLWTQHVRSDLCLVCSRWVYFFSHQLLRLTSEHQLSVHGRLIGQPAATYVCCNEAPVKGVCVCVILLPD